MCREPLVLFDSCVGQNALQKSRVELAVAWGRVSGLFDPPVPGLAALTWSPGAGARSRADPGLT